MQIELSQRTKRELIARLGEKTSDGCSFYIRVFLDCLARGDETILDTFTDSEIELFDMFLEHMMAVDDLEWREAFTLSPARFVAMVELFGRDFPGVDELKNKLIDAGEFAFLALVENARVRARQREQAEATSGSMC